MDSICCASNGAVIVSDVDRAAAAGVGADARDVVTSSDRNGASGRPVRGANSQRATDNTSGCNGDIAGAAVRHSYASSAFAINRTLKGEVQLSGCRAVNLQAAELTSDAAAVLGEANAASPRLVDYNADAIGGDDRAINAATKWGGSGNVLYAGCGAC